MDLSDVALAAMANLALPSIVERIRGMRNCIRSDGVTLLVPNEVHYFTST